MNIDEKDLLPIMQLIMYSGDAKGHGMRAIQVAKEGCFDEADDLLRQAHDSLIQAHHVQTDMLTREAAGDTLSIGLLMIHSQDHLMNAITCLDLAREMIDLYKKLG
ncbi:TPA: PTS lactose/cellobiose transporter subunit IIA [Streptococcus suis]